MATKVNEYNPFDLWASMPEIPQKIEISKIDLTDYLFEVKPGDKHSQLIFPDVPRGREQIEVMWIWIFGKPKYGKTTKCLSMVNAALKSGKYDLSKTQIMRSEDFVAMLERVRAGTEVGIFIVDDAHKHQSSFMMASTQGREHADATFLARHIFKDRTGLPYGVLIIFANAQEFRSINKWIRDQAVLVGYSGLIFEDPNIKRMPEPYVDELSRITRHIEEYKEQHWKSRMVVYIPHREKPNMRPEEYNNPYTTPYGVVNLQPIKRICPTCKTIFKSFRVACPTCGGKLEPIFEYRDPKTLKIKYIPMKEVLEEVPALTNTQRDLETLVKREELVDKLYSLTMREKLNPLEREFLDILQYKVSTGEWKDLLTVEERKMFEKEPLYYMRNIKGRYAAEQNIILTDKDNIDEILDLTEQIAPIENENTNRFNPSLINILNRLLSSSKINPRHYQMFKLLYFDKNGNFIKDPAMRPYTPHDIAQKFGVERAQVSKITGNSNHKDSVWQKILYELGHDYEKWVAEHIKFNNAEPFLFYDTISSRQVLLGGDTGQPDIIVYGHRNNKLAIDIISLKTIFYESTKTYHLIPKANNIHSHFAPELKAFSDAMTKREIKMKVLDTDGEFKTIDIKLPDNIQISLVILIRNVYYSDLELGYRFTSLNSLPKTITVSHKKFLKRQKVLKDFIENHSYLNEQELRLEMFKTFTNDPEGVPIIWKPL